MQGACGSDEAAPPGPALAMAGFETASVGMWSADGLVLAANAAAATLLGCSVAALVGRRSHDFTHPDDLASSALRRQHLFAGQSEDLACRD